MARLTKEERAVFNPTALLEKQKWQTELLIGKKEPGKEEGGHSPYQPWKPAPGGPYVPAPGKGKELAMDFQDALPRGGFVGTSRTNIFVNDGGEAYILKDGDFKFDGMYDPARHGPVFPQAKANDSMKIAQANKKDIKTPDNFSLEDMPQWYQENYREMLRQHEAEKLLNKEEKENNKNKKDLKIKK